MYTIATRGGIRGGETMLKKKIIEELGVWMSDTDQLQMFYYKITHINYLIIRWWNQQS